MGISECPFNNQEISRDGKVFRMKVQDDLLTGVRTESKLISTGADECKASKLMESRKYDINSEYPCLRCGSRITLFRV